MKKEDRNHNCNVTSKTTLTEYSVEELLLLKTLDINNETDLIMQLSLSM